MDRKRFSAFLLVTLVGAFQIQAITIDFNDLAPGSTPDSFNPYPGGVQIHTLWQVLESVDMPGLQSGYYFGTSPLLGGPQGASEYGRVLFSAHGQIQAATSPPPLDSPAVVVRTDNDWLQDIPLEIRSELDDPVHYVQISVEFGEPVSRFSVDAFSYLFSSRLWYSGFDASGQAITGVEYIPSWTSDEPAFHNLQVQAPAGGYISGFYFAQADFISTSLELRMDNLNYTHVPESGSSCAWLAVVVVGLFSIRHRLVRAE